jgi:ABC-type sulfate/molybdate transport systems ATPase subunit
VLDLDLTAQRGSFHLQVACRLASNWTVIFGPSGAGKSTLLRLLAGLDQNIRNGTTRATISLDGAPLTDTANRVWLQPGRRHTSLVAQQPALFPHLSVETNVAYGLSGLDRDLGTARVAEMLSLVDATDLIGRMPRDLSGGQAQRVALARALAPGTRLLLLDEPFSALDGVASDALISRLQRWLLAHKVQTILATHDATSAFTTGAEVVLLQEGRMAAQGSASEVLAAERARLLSHL